MDISPTFLFAIIVIFLYLSLLILNKAKLYKIINLPPGKMGWPIIGETSDLASSCKRGDLDKFIFDRMNRYSPDVFKTSLLTEKMAVFCGPTGNKFIFSNDSKLVKWWIPDSVAKILIPSCDYANREIIREQIRAIASEFSKSDALQKYIQTMDSIVRQHLDEEWKPNQTLVVYTMARKLLFSLSCRLFMGIEDKKLMTKLAYQFEIAAKGLFAMPIDLPGTTLRRAIRAANVMRSELQKIIRQEKLSKDKDSKSFSLLSYLLSATDSEGKFLSEAEIARTIMAVLLASQHTTSSLITNLVYFLADNPTVHDKALTGAEQLEIRKLKGEDKELLSWEDTKRMKYGRNVLNKVLRMAPTIIGFFRNALHDITFSGFTIPKGWKIFLSLNTMHKDPKYFPNPENFDPTRFEGNGPVPFTFTPFGGGPNLCPGNELARQVALVFMHNLLIKFKCEKLIPTEKIIYVHAVVVPANDLPIKLHCHCHEPGTGIS